MPVSDMAIDLRADQQYKVTGDVEILWNGSNGNQPDDMGNNRRAFASLVAFAPNGSKGPKGNFTFEVREDTMLHRQIKADVFAAVVHPEAGKAWLLALVIYDSKVCGDQGGSGDHEDGDECDHEDGESCDHEDDEGGGHDGGCSGEESDHGGGHLSGQECRLGQIVAVKVHDVDTPGSLGDAISWKWFSADAPNLPDIDMTDQWPHLCKKTILEGNLVVH